MRRIRLLMAVSVSTAGWSFGCASRDNAAPPQEDSNISVNLQDIAPVHRPLLPPPSRILAPELNSPRYAAMAVSIRPEPDARVAREILLHAALYAFAVDLAGRILGTDLRDQAPLILVPGETTDQDVDFQLRILAALDNVSQSVRWSRPADGSAASGRVLLGIRTDRREGARAAVFAEVTCQAARSASQRVEAVWDGAGWIVSPAGVLSEW